MNIMQQLNDVGINPFGVQLVAESLLKSPVAQSSADEPVALFYPVNRGDCAEWSGVEITIKAVRKTEVPNMEVSRNQQRPQNDE